VNVYLAAASESLAIAGGFMDRLEAAGHRVHRWDREVAAVRAAGKTDRDLSRSDRLHASAGDLQGIEDADVFWLLVPTEPSVGAWVEFGYALACAVETGGEKPQLVVSGDAARSIFLSQGHETFPDHETALRWILEQREPGSSDR
jgi:hypothetical protein